MRTCATHTHLVNETNEPPEQVPLRRPSLLQRLTLALERTRLLRGRVEEARTHIPLLDTALDVIERDSNVGGGILAGALAYRLFLFFLPLAFFLVSALGLVADAFGVTPRTVGEDLGFVGLVTKEVTDSARSGSGVWVALGSIVVLAYVTRVLYRAVAIVHALAWEHSAASAKTASRSMKVFALGLAGQLTLAVGVGAVRAQTSIGGIVVLVVYAGGLCGIWLAMSFWLPHSSAAWTDLLPGSVLYGLGMLGVNAFNVYLLDNVRESRSSTYGTLGTAAAILLTLFFIGRLVVASAVLNATLFERHRSR
jgi:membrane protein